MSSEWRSAAAGDLVYDDWPTEPSPVLEDWLPFNEDPARPTMVVASLDESGFPDSRTVLLSAWDGLGFFLHTDSRSRKVAQLRRDPRVALTIHLPADAHQITVQGRAEPAPADELTWAFAHRSPYLQQLAWQNTVEFASLGRDDRVRAWEEFQAAHPEGFTAPPTWTGFRVRPSRITFWVGSALTASRRTEYAREDDGPLADSAWTRRQLAG